MGDKMQAQETINKKKVNELKDAIYQVSAGTKLFSQFNFDNVKEAEKYKEKIEKLTPWNIENKYVKLKLDGSVLMILPGDSRKVSSSLFLKEPLFESGANLPERIQNDLIEKWINIAKKDPDLGFYPIFVNENISMVYLKITDKSKEEIEREFDNFGLGIKEVIEGEGIYNIFVKDYAKYDLYGGENMNELKVKKQEEEKKIQPIITPVQIMQDELKKLIKLYPNDPTLNNIKLFLDELAKNDRILTEYMPNILQFVIKASKGSELYESYSSEIKFFKDPNLNKYVFDLSKEKSKEIPEASFKEQSKRIPDLITMSATLAGKYEKSQQIAEDFRKNVFDPTIQTIKDYYDLKSKYDQLVADKIKLEEDIKKMQHTNPKASNRLQKLANSQEKEIKRLKERLEATDKKLNEIKKLTSRQYSSVSELQNDINTILTPSTISLPVTTAKSKTIDPEQKYIANDKEAKELSAGLNKLSIMHTIINQITSNKFILILKDNSSLESTKTFKILEDFLKQINNRKENATIPKTYIEFDYYNINGKKTEYSILYDSSMSTLQLIKKQTNDKKSK